MTIRSVTAVWFEPLFGTRESNSSKNSIEGLQATAFSKSSLTFYSDAPMYLSSISGPFTEIKFILNFLAIAEAM